MASSSAPKVAYSLTNHINAPKGPTPVNPMSVDACSSDEEEIIAPGEIIGAFQSEGKLVDTGGPLGIEVSLTTLEAHQQPPLLRLHLVECLMRTMQMKPL